MDPYSEVRRQVVALAEVAWRESVTAIFLGEVSPGFEVPGRRRDGTVEGTRKVRQFFVNAARIGIGGPVNVVLSVMGGGVANILAREGVVRGPAGAQALGLVDAARPAKGPWLVYSSSKLGIVDGGGEYEPNGSRKPPVFLWQEPGRDVDPRKRRIRWPDGSEFVYRVTDREAYYLAERRKAERERGL